MSKLNVLISGGGVAGSCLAWWLHRRNLTSKITVIERAPEPRISGQAVDIRNAAVNVIKQMGLEEPIKAKTTTEEGIEFVYADGKTKASFGTTGEDGAQSLTSEYEILRGDLAKIFYERTERLDGIEYVYDESISEIQEEKDGRIQVAFKNRLPQAEYDLVIGADGMISQTRRIVFGKGPEDKDYLHPLGQYCAFFTISRIGSDTKWAQWYVAPGGHAVVTRPDQYGETRAYLAVTDSNLSRFDEIKKAMKKNSEAQKAWLEKEFEGAGWQTARVVEGMKTAPDFYMTEIAQVKMDQFVTGRVALLGDAGYCPTPISGMGTSVAIIGAYILAGELSKSPTNVPKALEQYQAAMKPLIEQVQKLIPGAPQIVNPQSKSAVWLLNHITGLASYNWVKWIGSKVGSVFSPISIGSTSWELPDYSSI